ncbi:hypothetical protein B0H63DRAFT_533045 [Podospora didyma]|uniref:Pre-mRNA-processing protein prp40 n=1 Tax=Podospora didyma TaxID=330526 RepID=A0AAE0P7M1_9PEZI|nr:hypothetical protein B0H63DRAFT_533045 [Podospora didyma]
MSDAAASFPPPGPAAWQFYQPPDGGRAYYFNKITNVTQWDKPVELMTPAELARAKWKEYATEDGRKYWYNTETKVTTWNPPEGFEQTVGANNGTPAAAGLSVEPLATTPGGYAGSGGAPHDNNNYREQRDNRDYRDRDYRDHREHREPLGESRQLTYGNNTQAQAFVPASNDPEYATAEEAEAAFIKLLRRSNVQPDSTWEQTLRAVAKDPQFRAIKDPKDRKTAFEKYCNDVIVQDKERAKERLTKLRADFATMLRSHPEIKHYTRWKTARPIIEGETIFRSTNNEDERRELFSDYVIKLKQAYKENQVATRKSAMDGLIELLPKLNLEPYTRWADAQETIHETDAFKTDDKYKSLSKYDVLTVFQNHVKSLERAFNDSRQREKNKQHRKERQARDNFIAMLAELKASKKIKVGSKWDKIYPLLENDDRYKDLVGQPGSTPMDLFWDVVEEEERAIRSTRNEVLDVIDDKRFDVTAKTTFEEFESAVRDDRRTAGIDRDVLEYIFERQLQEKKAKRSDDDRQSERQQRRAVDSFRSALKRVEPPVSVTDTYDQVKSRIAQSEEFQAVSSEEARQAAFDRHIRRLKEKEEEAEKDRQRRRDRGDGYRGDRGERSHRNGERSARSHTPERDPYEADRRKAIAERERNHRKSSMAESLLSDHRGPRSTDSHHDPAPARERDRRDRRDREPDRDREPRSYRDRERERDHRGVDRDRDRERGRGDYDRRPRADELNHYDRERRTREEDRETTYRRRVIDRDVDELPYGDERPSSSRRPRADDEDDRKDARVAKRPRIETSEHTPRRESIVHHNARTPPKEKEKTPAVSVRAGSEEGEIEED